MPWGYVKKYKEQFLATRFITFGVPLIPTGGFFVINSDEEGFHAKSNYRSVIKAYLSVIAGFACVVLATVIALHFFSQEELQYDLMVQAGGISIIPIILYVCCHFMLFNTSKEEKKERELYFQTTGISALPSFFKNESLISIKDSLLEQLADESILSSADAISMAKSSNYSKEILPLLFAIVGYEREIETSRELNLLYEKLKKEYEQTLCK